MTQPHVVVATLAHVAYLASRLRRQDQEELTAASGMDPADALRYMVRTTPDLWAVLEGHQPIALFGAIPRDEAGVAIPWMVGTDRLMAHPRWVARESRAWFRRLGGLWPVLTNWSDARQATHHRWLEWIGARFVEEASKGPEGLTFRRWEYRA
jgi:hypothetical protein